MKQENDDRRNVSQDRRTLIKLGLTGGAAGAALMLVGNLPAIGRDIRDIKESEVLAKTRDQPNPKRDAEIVNNAIILEQKAVNTYEAAAKNKLLPTKAFLDVALQFASDHAQHRDRLAKAVSTALKMAPANTSNLGTFPIPKAVLQGAEEEVIRYALTLEMIASKTYFEAITQKLTTDEARDLAASIMPVENQHAAVFRSVLMVVLKTKGLPGDNRLVPYAFLDEQPMPAVPKAG